MSDISDELRERLLSQLNEMKPQLANFANIVESNCAYVEVPVFLDGVIDFVRFNVAEKRFDELQIRVGNKGGMRVNWGFECDTTAAYFEPENIETVSIPLPLNFMEGINA